MHFSSLSDAYLIHFRRLDKIQNIEYKASDGRYTKTNIILIGDYGQGYESSVILNSSSLSLNNLTTRH